MAIFIIEKLVGNMYNRENFLHWETKAFIIILWITLPGVHPTLKAPMKISGIRGLQEDLLIKFQIIKKFFLFCNVSTFIETAQQG